MEMLTDQNWEDLQGTYGLKWAETGGRGRCCCGPPGRRGPVLRGRRVCDGVVGVAGEGDGDSVAGAPVDLLHPVQVLRP